MKQSSYYVLHAKLYSLSHDKREKLLSFVTDEEKKKIEEAIPEEDKLELNNLPPYSLLDICHYSWLLPTLKSYEENDAHLFLSAIEHSEASHLQEKLGISDNFIELKKGAKNFLRLMLDVSLSDHIDTLLPTSCLPKSPLNPLALLDKNQLTKLVDLLGLFDLAKELQKTVDPKILQEVNKFLSKSHKEFISKLMKNRDTTPVNRIGLNHWNKDHAALKHLLHKRGLRRLATALSGAHPDLIWYVSHKLDIGRGGALLQLCKKKVENQTEPMIDCVVEALEALQ